MRPEREWESFVVSEDDHIDHLAQAEISIVVPVAVAARLRRSHFLFLGYPLHEWSLRVFLHPVSGRERVGYRSLAIGHQRTAIPRVGHRPRAAGARAGTLARPAHRELRPAARGLRGCARETALRGDRRVSADESPSPYKGLTPFEDSDLDVRFFFGRDRERELIEANLMASRLTVLYGETGVGKSSVLRAGVAHHLRSLAEQNLSARGEPGVAVVVFDAWRGDPARELRIAVAAAVTRALGGSLEPPDQDVPLAEALRMWETVLAGDIYVVLDQAEEYFLYHGGDDRENGFAVEFPA